MRKMKLKAIVMSGVMAASLLAAIPAAAAEPYTNPAEAKVVKTIDKNDGIEMPEVIFTFTATQTDNPTDQPAAPAQVALDSVTIKSTADPKSASFDLSKLTVPGLYTYKIEETNDAAAKEGGYGWDYNTASASYTMSVLVDNNGVQKIYLYDKDNKKVETMDFNNKFTKKAALEISKVVSNPEYANPDDEFKVDVTFTRPDVKNDTITSYTGKIGETEYTFTPGQATTVTLKAGDKLVFDNLEAGATYTVKETDMNSNYSWEKTEVVANGGNSTSIQNDGTTNNLVGENTNTAKITNKFKDVTITGVMTTYGPFVAMIAAAVAAIAVYAAVRRKVSR